MRNSPSPKIPPLVFESLDFAELSASRSHEKLWRLAVAEYQAKILDGHKPSDVVCELANCISKNVPGICKSTDVSKRQIAIERQIYRKVQRVAEKGDVVDLRLEANKKKAGQELSREDRKPFLNSLVYRHYGDLDTAWRECIQQKKFSPELLSRYPIKPRCRVRCPRVIRRQFPYKLVKRLLDLAHRPRKAKQSGPYMVIRHDDYFAGDWFTSDDFTLELYYATGNPECPLRRGQFLPLADCRSKRILTFAQIDAETYRQDDILRLLRKSFITSGIPRCGLHFERGSWYKGKMLGGKTRNLLGEFESSLASRLNIQLRHSLPGSPRGKIIENVGKLLQRYVRAELRWVGSDEKKLVFEHSQKAIADVRAARIDAREAGFLTREELVEKLRDEIIPEYNSTIQQSIVYGGNKVVAKTPDEAWQELQPPVSSGIDGTVAYLPPALHYIFDHREIKAVTRNGIRLPYCGGLTYRNESLGKFIGQNVIVYFDPESIESVTVSDLQGEELLTVERIEPVRRWTATPDEISAGMRQVREFDNFPRTLLAEIKTAFRPPAKKFYAGDGGFERALEVGRQINERKELAKANARQTAPTESREERAMRRAANQALIEAVDPDRL